MKMKRQSFSFLEIITKDNKFILFVIKISLVFAIELFINSQYTKINNTLVVLNPLKGWRYPGHIASFGKQSL